MPTDTSEKGLESLIVTAMTGERAPRSASGGVAEEGPPYGGTGYVAGDPADYDRAHVVDLAKLLAFLRDTQPEPFEQLAIEGEGPRRQQFLARLQGEVAKRGVIDVLRHGIKHGPA
jgi:type I restriction enzyme, R subunit